MIALALLAAVVLPMPSTALAISGETTVVAQVPCTVTFEANGHGTSPATQLVNVGQRADPPAAPFESGWTFCGWYASPGCDEAHAFDFSAPITGDITLWAKWTQAGTPRTGDPTQRGLWAALAITGGAGGLAGIAAWGRRRSRE